MIKALTAITLIALCTACVSGIRRPDAPDDLIGRDSMVVVLRELVVMESYLQNKYQHVNNYYKVMTASGKACLKKFRIPKDRFERSYNYYVSRQEELQGIYSEVIDSLTKEANALGAGTPNGRPNTPIQSQPQ